MKAIVTELLTKSGRKNEKPKEWLGVFCGDGKALMLLEEEPPYGAVLDALHDPRIRTVSGNGIIFAGKQEIRCNVYRYQEWYVRPG